jgi:hypothetical protein
MKLLKALFSVTVIAFTVTNVQAMPAATPTHNLNSSIPILFVHTISKESHYFDSYTASYYGGVSQKDPCSDLHLLRSFTFLGVKDSTYIYDSEHLVSYFGERLTCVKTDILWNSKTSSTGNIQLLWDEDALSYVAATPSKVTIDLDQDGTPGS